MGESMPGPSATAARLGEDRRRQEDEGDYGHSRMDDDHERRQTLVLDVEGEEQETAQRRSHEERESRLGERGNPAGHHQQNEQDKAGGSQQSVEDGQGPGPVLPFEM